MARAAELVGTSATTERGSTRRITSPRRTRRRNRAGAQEGDGGGGVFASDRCVVHARRVHPGTDTVGFDGPAETITLIHTARDRTAFARGALIAATWVRGKRGWFTMHDVLGLSQ